MMDDILERVTRQSAEFRACNWREENKQHAANFIELLDDAATEITRLRTQLAEEKSVYREVEERLAAAMSQLEKADRVRGKVTISEAEIRGLWEDDSGPVMVIDLLRRHGVGVKADA